MGCKGRLLFTDFSSTTGFKQPELARRQDHKSGLPSEQADCTTEPCKEPKQFGVVLMPGGGVEDDVNGVAINVAPAYNISTEVMELIVDLTAIASISGETNEIVRL
ncbi:hypothetical protein J1614_010306 [Plenodomus biglobosus]|nr:hypothetical protein J1614_010306 [Plenodomus biglobosus]